MTEFEFGQRVVFTHPLSRVRVPVREVEVETDWFGKPGTEKRSINREWVALDKPAGAGIVIGKRTLSSGHSYFESDGDWGGGGYWQYDRAENFTAYLIATDLYSKPVLVRPETMKAVKQ